MYAIIETGGKQLKVTEGQIVKVEKLAAAVGDSVSFDQVLMVVSDEVAVGQPVLANAVVEGTVVEQGKGPKLVSFRYKPKKRVRVKKGHRQPFTAVKINSIRF